MYRARTDVTNVPIYKLFVQIPPNNLFTVFEFKAMDSFSPMSESSSVLWSRCLESIRRKIQVQSFKTWFGPTSSSRINSEEVVIEVPTSFFGDWLDEHYAWLIKAAVEEETTWKPRIEFVVRGVSEKPSNLSSIPLSPTENFSVKKGSFLPSLKFPPSLNLKYRFENFVVGQSNEVSFTVAKAVAEKPGQTAFNPLIIYGGVGLGKTHLLQAIGDYCIRKRTAENIVYVTAEKFISDYISSIRKNDTSGFVKTYRSADVLLVDDIQYFVKTEGCQREFIHTFNTLYQNDKQIVISSDRPPSFFKGFEDRLISRFESGLITDIDIPDFETRIAILEMKSEELGMVLPGDVSRFLAEQTQNNIRELEGTLKRLLAISNTKKLPLTVNLARKNLILPPDKHSSPLSIKWIQKTVASFFHISIDNLVGPNRKKEYATARHVSMYLSKSMTDAPLKTIGNQFGNRDHTTVIHACKRIEKKLQTDPGFEGIVLRLQKQIKNQTPS